MACICRSIARATSTRAKADLDVSTLADWVGACAATLMPLVETIRGHVFAAERIHADDTTVPVLAKGKTRTGRLWTYVRDNGPFGGSDPPVAAFFYSRDRAGEHPDQHLASYAGLMQADAYAGYVAPKIMLWRQLRDPGTAVIGVNAAHNYGAPGRLQALQERHQRGLCSIAARCLRKARDIEAGQGLGLHLHIDLGIDMRRVQRDVSQPDRLDGRHERWRMAAARSVYPGN